MMHKNSKSPDAVKTRNIINNEGLSEIKEDEVKQKKKDLSILEMEKKITQYLKSLATTLKEPALQDLSDEFIDIMSAHC